MGRRRCRLYMSAKPSRIEGKIWRIDRNCCAGTALSMTLHHSDLRVHQAARYVPRYCEHESLRRARSARSVPFSSSTCRVFPLPRCSRSAVGQFDRERIPSPLGQGCGSGGATEGRSSSDNLSQSRYAPGSTGQAHHSDGAAVSICAQSSKTHQFETFLVTSNLSPLSVV